MKEPFLGKGKKADPSHPVSLFLDSIEGREITKQEGNFSLLLLGTGIGGCLRPYSEKYGFDFGRFLFFVQGKRGTVFFDAEKYAETTSDAFRRFFSQKGSLQEIIDFESLKQDIDAIYDSNPPSVLSRLDDGSLINMIRESFRKGFETAAATVFVESLDEEQIRKLYRELGTDKDVEEFIKNSSYMMSSSFTLRADEVILEDSHPEKAQYIFCDYYLAPDILTIEEMLRGTIRERGGVEKIVADIEAARNEMKMNQVLAFDYRNALPEEKALLFDFVQMSINLRDSRKDVLQKILTLLSNLLKEFLKRRDGDPEDAAFAIYSDFIDNQYQAPDYPKELARRREQGMSALFSDNGVTVELGEVEKKRQAVFDVVDKDRTQHIQGKVAYAGNVTGIARIIIDEGDFSKFNEGEILVTSMTRPEFVPLMKKAIAVITDEGGITCHAAIVARELKLPCVIGTRTATRLLKDGDRVELSGKDGKIRAV